MSIYFKRTVLISKATKRACICKRSCSLGSFLTRNMGADGFAKCAYPSAATSRRRRAPLSANTSTASCNKELVRLISKVKSNAFKLHTSYLSRNVLYVFELFSVHHYYKNLSSRVSILMSPSSCGQVCATAYGGEEARRKKLGCIPLGTCASNSPCYIGPTVGHRHCLRVNNMIRMCVCNKGVSKIVPRLPHA